MTTPTPTHTTLPNISAAEWQQVLSALNMEPETTVYSAKLKIAILRDDNELMTGQIQYLREQNRQLLEALEYLRQDADDYHAEYIRATLEEWGQV